MSDPAAAPSWFGPSVVDSENPSPQSPREFERLWRGFMTARVTLGLVLALLQVTIFALGTGKDPWLIAIAVAYLIATLLVRMYARARPLGKPFGTQWLVTIGVDIVIFATFQIIQGASINYTPLLALPVLIAAVLGSLLVAMGTAAGVTLLLLLNATWLSILAPHEIASQFLQAALTGAGCFVVSFLSSQISTRLASEEIRAQRSQLAARIQRQVNELVIEFLSDGVLVVDSLGVVRAVNPAARQMLGCNTGMKVGQFSLSSVIGWQPLVDLMQQGFLDRAPEHADVLIVQADRGLQRLRVRTQLTMGVDSQQEGLCVMFLQDLREMEARMRNDKLASMGRMSAAVAHEIRNPLAAIAQANDLLDEDLSDPRHKQLTLMVQQNARRLEKIVDEILDLSRVQGREQPGAQATVPLSNMVLRICQDWQQQTKTGHAMRLDLSDEQTEVYFESEHLRRVLINLLDNARRYASGQLDAIVVSTQPGIDAVMLLRVWSDAAPMEPSVERHLFEPFFSSESRSTGLGLYICRELCQGHGAAINYQRAPRKVRGQLVGGNEFSVSFRTKTKAGINSHHNPIVNTVDTAA